MPCKEFRPEVCDGYTTRATVCASSNSGYIAATVTVNQNCSFQYTLTLQQYNPSVQKWINVGERSGLASTGGTNHQFDLKKTKASYRVRCKVLASGAEGTTASFVH